MTPRRLALFFATTHVAMLAVPAATGGRRVRWLAVADAVPALAVAAAVVRDRPVRTRLRVGAAADLSRILAVRALLPQTPRPLAVAITAGSLTGAALASAISTRVD